MKKKANSIKEELILLTKNGILNPHDVVEYAKNPETHLHSKFEWDNTKAAHEYRLEQARKTIRLHLNVIQTNDNEEKVTRYFISLKEDRIPGGGYRTMNSVLSDSEKREKLLDEALQELIRIRMKYQDLNELSEIFSKIDKLKKNRKLAKESSKV
ncbi:MAG: hypothetical protein ACOC2M_00195 [bacterium]